ncbi:MAG: histidine kinase, partial [Comamonadaceae bacterium]|nr:histidine kinase [Comamonadaceae bacterium]
LTQPHRLLLRLSWPGQALGSDCDGLMCMDADGLITGTNRTAAHMLGLLPGSPRPHGNDVFAVACETLFDAATAHSDATEVPLWSGLRMQLLARLNNGFATFPTSRSTRGGPLPLKDLQEVMIRKAVEDARGNVMEAARVLGISRATVYRKLQRRSSVDQAQEGADPG